MDLIGQRFGLLEVVGYAGFVMAEYKNRVHKENYWYCLCDCGSLTKKRQACLRSGDTRSCGCWGDRSREDWIVNLPRGDKYNTELGIKWRTMKGRCFNPKAMGYHNYGGRGIKICDEWMIFANFYEWSIASGYAEGLTIERIDNDGDYCPENCKWVTRQEQANNRRTNRPLTLNGVTKNLGQWAIGLGISKGALKQRIDKYHWSIEDALTIPPGGKRDRS
jgi:hypothetical protein